MNKLTTALLDPRTAAITANVGISVFFMLVNIIAIIGMKQTIHQFGFIVGLVAISEYAMLFSMSLVALLADSFPIKLSLGLVCLVLAMTF